MSTPWGNIRLTLGIYEENGKKMATTILGYIGFRGLEFVVGSDFSWFVVCSDPRQKMKLPFKFLSHQGSNLSVEFHGGFKTGGYLGPSLA